MEQFLGYVDAERQMATIARYRAHEKEERQARRNIPWAPLPLPHLYNDAFTFVKWLNREESPSVIDMQGRCLKIMQPVGGSSCATISRTGLKLSNVNFNLESGVGSHIRLAISSKGGIFKGVNIKGGGGFWVLQGAEVKLLDCKFEQCLTGIMVGDPRNSGPASSSAKLFAARVSLKNSGVTGLSVCPNGFAQLAYCKIFGSGDHGIHAMLGMSPRLVATGVMLVGNRKEALRVKYSEQAVLVKCSSWMNGIDVDPQQLNQALSAEQQLQQDQLETDYPAHLHGGWLPPLPPPTAAAQSGPLVPNYQTSDSAGSASVQPHVSPQIAKPAPQILPGVAQRWLVEENGVLTIPVISGGAAGPRASSVLNPNQAGLGPSDAGFVQEIVGERVAGAGVIVAKEGLQVSHTRELSGTLDACNRDLETDKPGTKQDTAADDGVKVHGECGIVNGDTAARLSSSSNHLHGCLVRNVQRFCPRKELACLFADHVIDVHFRLADGLNQAIVIFGDADSAQRALQLDGFGFHRLQLSVVPFIWS